MLRRPVARAGGRGLIGTMATTAVVAGTATAVSGRVARRQAGKAEQAAKAEAYDDQQQYAAQPAAAQQAAQQAAAQAPAAPQGDVVAQLTQLAALKDQGVLTEAEFAAQKAKLLGS
jgi:hypothetical protein